MVNDPMRDWFIRIVRALWHSRFTPAILVIAVLSTVSVALVARADDMGTSAVRSPFAVAVGKVGGATCEVQPTREACTDIEMDGRIWRYALLPADEQTSETVVVDFGGPSLSVLSGEVGLSAFRAAFKELSRRYNILVVEEPWVTEMVPADCRAALTAYYLSLRSSTDTISRKGTEMAQRCELSNTPWRWGFDSVSYAKLVRAISQRHGLKVKGFVGHSWGSVRLAYLDRSALDWAILVRPFPVGVSAPALLKERARMLADVSSNLQLVKPTVIRGRSLPVIPFDQLSAMIGLAYVDDTFFENMSGRILDGTDMERIGRLSDRLWGRYGRDSISPGMLALFQEVCAIVGPTWEDIRQINSVRDIFLARHAPCRAVPIGQLSPVVIRSMCVVTSRRDAVAPDRLVRLAYESASEKIKFVESKERSHSSFDGLEHCLKGL
jgi:hypothetical protein